MQHRHLNHQGYTPAAIDDIIARGKRQDWAELGQALKRDPALRPIILRLAEARISDPYAQRYHAWYNYVQD
jgi:hypothetical protein